MNWHTEELIKSARLFDKKARDNREGDNPERYSTNREKAFVARKTAQESVLEDDGGRLGDTFSGP